ncbi:MAG TPA: methyltransferase [Spirochaetia bacterium]|nr:methyltransferase [Spirochaetia bacterium]
MIAPRTKFPLDYVNKTISVKFFGRESLFHLSHGLFSSNDIDAGTRLLLRCIGARLDLSHLGSILDVGCGAGVLGVTIGRASPGAHIMLQDRDALAVAFARENCVANELQNADLDCGLAFWHLQGESFDLIVSNLPAKAGRPVLQSFFSAAAGLLSRTGVGAVVIVSPLAQFAREAVQSSGCLLFHAESTGQHTAFFFQKPENAASDAPAFEDLGPYLRGRHAFDSGGVRYELETAFNLPDFDTIGYSVEVAQEILPASRLQGDSLFWNPGQGHLPVCAQKKASRGFETLAIAGHDALELAISERNLASAGRQVSRSLLLPTEAGLAEAVDPESIDLLCAVPHPVPKAPWHMDLALGAGKILRKGGEMLAAGTSTDIFRVLDQCRGFKLVESVKRLGHRAVLLRKN